MSVPRPTRSLLAEHGRQAQRPAAIALLLAAALSTPALADAVPLVTFRTVHDLTLDQSVPSSDMLGVTARLVTQFTGSSCSGYTDQTRFVMQTTATDGTRQTSDLRQTTVETAGGHLNFDEKVYADGKLAEQSMGNAVRQTGGDVAVTLTQPAAKQLSLAATALFPTELTQKTIAAAVAGKRFLSDELYSGDSAGETIYVTSTVIGAMSTAADFGHDMAIGGTTFATEPHWPVTIAYFDKAASGDSMPLYTTSYMLYQNGMISHLKIIYPDFTLVGTLSSLDILPAAACP